MKSPINRHLIMILGMLMLGLLLVGAQNALALANDLTTEALQERITLLENNTQLPEPQKAKAIDYLRQAVTAVTSQLETTQKIDALRESIESAAEQIQLARTTIATLSTHQPDGEALPEDISLQQAELLLASESGRLQELKQQATASEVAVTEFRTLAKTLVGDLDQHLQKAAELEAELNQPSTQNDEAPEVSHARQSALLARKASREARISLLSAQFDNQPLLLNLLIAQRDLAQAELTAKQESIRQLTSQITALREIEARAEMQKALQLQEQVADMPLEIQALADENLQLSNELKELVVEQGNTNASLERSRHEVSQVTSDFESVKSRVDLLGSTEAMGRLLKRRIKTLPTVKKYRTKSLQITESISISTNRQIDIDDRLKSLKSPEEYLSGLSPESSSIISGERYSAIKEATQTLVTSLRERLLELQQRHGQQINNLTQLDISEKKLVNLSRDYIQYIREQLLYVRSVTPFAVTDLAALGQAINWWIAPANWEQLASDIRSLLTRSPAVAILVGLLVLLLFALKPVVKRSISRIAPNIGRIKCDSYLYTLQAFLATLVLALPLSLLLWTTGMGLSVYFDSADFSYSIGAGMVQASYLLFATAFLGKILLPEGLAAIHFNWPRPVHDQLTTELRWFTPVITILTLMFTASSQTTAPDVASALGRPLFIAALIAWGWILWKMLSQTSSLNLFLEKHHPDSWLYRLRFLWFPLLMLLVVALGVLSLTGYHHTAVYLYFELFWSTALVVGLVIMRGLLSRWLQLSERRLRYQDALKRLHEAREQRANPQPAIKESELVREAEVDYVALSNKAQQLLHSGILFTGILGIWLIWSDLLPTLNLFNDISLPLSATEIVDGIEKQVPVTLGDLLIALLAGVITYIAAKNLPAVIEIAILQRLPLATSSRYAITTIGQYLIVAIGIIAVFSHIGIEWSNIQWLVAALGVGLGFGLQEIVANFISGIIILFEKPIRVGDLVTVGDATGNVTQINIRATTIRNWDKQELLVPNKEFITSRVLNWTLSDQLNRLLITVGIAYGSDVPKAIGLIKAVADEHPRVLDEPPAVITFEGFGDNSLTIKLRAYLDSIEYRLQTISEIHQAINDKFNAAGIVIAFPQRDVHLDIQGPLPVKVVDDSRQG